MRLVPMEGDLIALKRGVTVWVYQAVLDRHLPLILGLGSIFMQDNAPIHKSYAVTRWLKEIGIKIVD